MPAGSTDEDIAERVAYVREFEAVLLEAAADALREDAVMAGLQIQAFYSPQERVQAAWAGADLDMPNEEAVGLLLILGAMAEADKERGRSFLSQLTRKQSEHGRIHAALAAHARDVLLAGLEPSSPDIFERFTAHYSALLREGRPVDVDRN